MIGGGAGQQERLGIEGGCSSSWDDVKLSPLTCMSLAMGLAFERGIGFGFCFCFCIGPSRVRSGRDRFSRRCPNAGVSIGVLSGPVWLPDAGGCKSSASEQAKLGAEEPRGYVQRVWQFLAPILRAV